MADGTKNADSSGVSMRNVDAASDPEAHTIVGDTDANGLPIGGAAATRAESNPEGVLRAEMPEQFGRYRVDRILGQGAMGAVYLAHDTQLDRPVALKVPTFGPDAPQNLGERFQREARAAATLTHPNICPIHDVGEFEGTRFISMAYIEGRPLSDYAESKKEQSQRQVARVVRKIALALAEAHDKGIVHRDLKPANVMIDRRGEPIVMDFGLARHVDDDAEARLTKDGAVVGTPAYMAPEQLRGERDSGPATDIYSLGVLLFEMLAGRRPFQGTVVAMIGQILYEDPPTVESQRADVDRELQAICRKAMARDPADRFASMHAFAKALADFLKRDGSSVTSGVVAAEVLEPVAEEFPAEIDPAWSSAPVAKSRPPRSRTRSRATSGRGRSKKQSGNKTGLIVAVGGGALAIGLIVGLAVALNSGNGDDDEANAFDGDGSSGVADVDPGEEPQPRFDGPVGRPSRPIDGDPNLLFARRDLNDDGVLDATELDLHVIRRADQNGDERLVPEEFRRALKRLAGDLFAPPRPEQGPPPRFDGQGPFGPRPRRPPNGDGNGERPRRPFRNPE